MTDDLKKHTDSYLELMLHLDGKGTRFLRVPTFWDVVKKQWLGAIKTPDTLKLIHAHGEDSIELRNNFILAFSEALEDRSINGEIFSMFKSREFWEVDDLD